MQNIAVFVATTAGPVRIERITPEGAPQSMVCVGRSSDVLPISGDYDDFVRAGSGVILREFGHADDRSYRLDASAPIDGGKSWQLGVYLAHAIHASSETTLSNCDEADLILWCSGTVDYDLNIGPVNHIAHKVETSSDVLNTAGTPIIAVIANDNIADAYALPSTVETLTSTTAKEALNRILGSAPKALTTAPKQIDQTEPPRTSRSFLPWIGMAVAIGALAFVIWPKLQTSEPKPTPVTKVAPTVQKQGVTPKTDVVPVSLPDPAPKQASGPEIHISSDRGTKPYTLGESLSLSLALTQDAWVYCFYRQSNGETVQILPNPAFNKKHKQPKLTGHKTYALPGDQLFPFDLKAAKPVGTDQMICFAANQDIAPLLPAALSGKSYKPLPDVLSQGLTRIFAEISAKTGEIRIQNSQIPIKIQK